MSAKTAAKLEAETAAARRGRILNDPNIESKLKSWYSKGGTFNEYLAANPASFENFFDEHSKGRTKTYNGYKIWPVWGGWKTSLNALATFATERECKQFIDTWVARHNPAAAKGDFQQCVDAVSAKGGAVDPGARAWVRRNSAYQDRLAKRLGAPHLSEYMPSESPAERLAQQEREVNRIKAAAQRKGAILVQEYRKGGNYYMVYDKWAGRRATVEVKSGGLSSAKYNPSIRKTKKESKKFMDTIPGFEGRRQFPGLLGKSAGLTPSQMRAYKKRKAERGNPSAAAADVYEEFHGRRSEELVKVRDRVHIHEHLAALGALKKLVVDGVDGYRHELVGFGKAILCSNETKNQLFIRGGSQSLDLAEFGIDHPHEIETLGEVVEIRYFTTKDHLGSEGGTALYFHKSGTTVSASGSHRKVGYGPDLIYRTRDEALEFAGGTYEIKAEGIDK